MEEKKMLSYSPHIRDNTTTAKIMLDVILALLPAAIAGIYFFGWNAAKVILLSVAAAVGSEALIQWLCKKKITVSDGSAAVTGLLLAMTLPSSAPWYIPVIGAVFAIGVCKQSFGGLGQNFINPALAARAMLTIAWPTAMTAYSVPHAVDAVSSATQLAGLSAPAPQLFPIWDLLCGNVPGSLGETCKIAILLGGIYLLVRKRISWHIPVAFLGAFAVFTLLAQPVSLLPYQILSGGLLLGALFMATDYVTSPKGTLAKLIFGVGCGVITGVIRFYGGYNEGVCFAILLMNVATPLLERYCRPKRYGEKKRA